VVLEQNRRPVAEPPVLEVASATHTLADLTLGLGKVVHDYLQQPVRRPLQVHERSLVTSSYPSAFSTFRLEMSAKQLILQRAF
jgi:hypothetical protein